MTTMDTVRCRRCGQPVVQAPIPGLTKALFNVDPTWVLLADPPREGERVARAATLHTCRSRRKKRATTSSVPVDQGPQG